MSRKVHWHKTLALLLAAFACAGASLISSPIPPSSEGNLLLDLDRDGRLDAIQLEFVSQLDSSYLAQQLDSVVLFWPDTSGSTLRLRIQGTDFSLDTARPRRLTYAFPPSLPLSPYLTSLQTAPVNSGSAFCFSGGDSMPVRLRDSMQPIIAEASLSRGQPASPDTLRLLFSERVAPLRGDALLETKDASGQARPLALRSLGWTTESELVALLERGVLGTGDSLRLLEGAIGDLAGNLAQEGPWHGLSVRSPFYLRSQGMAEAWLGGDWKNKPMFQIDFYPYGDTVKPSDWLGIGLDFGGPGLVNAIQAIQGEASRNQPDPSAAQWLAELWVYAGDGQPVHHSHLKIACDDARFSAGMPRGDCFSYPAQVFLRWNLRTLGGKAAATGAYVARISSRVAYEGQTLYSATPYSPHGTQVWGIRRSQHGSP